MNIIDAYEHTGEGYNPFLITGRWQVALMNYTDFETVARIERLDVHHKTDEVFVLLKGHSALIAAQINGDDVTYEVVDMKPNVVYNIRREVWHRMTMQPGSQVLIVEDNDTHLGDFEFYYLSPKQKQQLVKAVDKATAAW